MKKKLNYSIFKRYSLPPELKNVLQSNLVISESNSRMTNLYIELLENLKSIERIDEEYYLDYFHTLLYIEEYEKSKRKHKELQTILKGCQLEKKYFNRFTVCASDLSENDYLIKLHDLIFLNETTSNNNVNKRFYIAKVVKIYEGNFDFVINNNSKFKFHENKKYDISVRDSNFPLKICHYALDEIQSFYNIKLLINPEIKKDTLQYYSITNFAWFNESIKKNPEQMQVVKNVINKTAYPAPYILFGPPGTGKTATLVELICQAIVCQPRLLVTLRSRVLVCATSNAAVDEITIRLLKYLPAEIMCRIYSQSYDRSKVNKTILPCSYFLKDYLGFIRTALHFQIILVTNITCACLLNTDLGRNLFSYVIIDEASQATEPETILPFLFGPLIPMMKSQVVLAGDPYQLGPVILSRIAKPLLGISMLERLMNFPMYKQDKDNNYDSRYVTKLKQNYRSHECILHVSNQEFYESELIACGDGRIINSAIGWSKLPNKYFPIIFHSSYGIEKSKKYSSSMYNLEEISIIMKYLNLLLGVTFGDIKIEQGHIGIVSPFKQQKLEIIERLKKRKMNSITVGSVEEFQGSEKEIIILTTVRSRVFNHDGIQNIGFLSEERRFNVALTRAKCLLIIIGNPTVLETNKHWKVLLEYCRKNNAFTKSFK